MLLSLAPPRRAGWAQVWTARLQPGARAMSSSAPSAQRVAAQLKPTFVNGRWRKPALSGRQAAATRREWRASGRAWPAELTRAAGVMRLNPTAAHQPLLAKAERDARVAANVARMGDIVEDYRKYLHKAKGDAYDNRELHIFYDRDELAGK